MNDGTQALDEIWNNWKNENQWYLSTTENDAKLVAEMTRMAESGHPLDRELLDVAARTLANQGQISIVPMSFVKKPAPAVEPIFESKRFAQDTLTSGTSTADGHLSVLKVREWQKEREEERKFDELQFKLRAAKEKDARNAPEPEEISGELPISLMDSPEEESRVLQLPQVTPQKIRRYLARKGEETLRRMQEKARQR